MMTVQAPSRLASPRSALPSIGRKSDRQVTDDRRGNASDRGYGARWRRARAHYLRDHPLCCCCKANGRIVASSVVDHIEPHRGDMVMFWKPSNWQALCKACHDGVKATIERMVDAGKGTSADLRLDRYMPHVFPT